MIAGVGEVGGGGVGGGGGGMLEPNMRRRQINLCGPISVLISIT